MWQAYYGDVRHSSLHTSQIAIKQQLLQRAVAPVFAYRCPRWTWSATRAKRLDAIQNVMVAKCLRVAPLPSEDHIGYRIRRSRLASELNRGHRWSVEWQRRLRSWNDHVNRHHESWMFRLLAHHNAAWIQEQRRLHGTSASGSRTCTRTLPGRVATWWQEAFQNMK